MVNSSSVVFTLLALIAMRAGSVEALRSGCGAGEEEDALEVGGGGVEEEAAPAQYNQGAGGRAACSGGCGAAHSRLRARPVLLSLAPLLRPEPEQEANAQPRPLFGLIGNILETVRYGRDIDDRRPHILF